MEKQNKDTYIKDAYRVIIEEGEGEIVEKKSRFLATVKKVETEEEAVAFVDSMKKKYWDASHNCSAMVLGGQVKLTRFSDDGEPSGTAGRPMLEVLLGENISNVAVVVTRYFGGTLLGTGGLVRAYTQATKEGLAACRIGCMRPGVRMKLVTDYNNIGKILYLLGERNLVPENSEYTDIVCLYLLVPVEWKEELMKEFTEVTAGKVDVEILQEAYYIDKE
ncbi:MAG TPA: YigZ family protein [Lachnospiraceae bacterium]|nr:YigZ family protein [Lachnospiraceae bacterium]